MNTHKDKNCILWFHKWSKWSKLSDPFYIRNRVHYLQRKSCKKCNLIKERVI